MSLQLICRHQLIRTSTPAFPDDTAMSAVGGVDPLIPACRLKEDITKYEEWGNKWEIKVSRRNQHLRH